MLSSPYNYIFFADNHSDNLLNTALFAGNTSSIAGQNMIFCPVIHQLLLPEAVGMWRIFLRKTTDMWQTKCWLGAERQGRALAGVAKNVEIILFCV